MNRDETLTTAAALINGDRAKDYGDASVNFQRIADLWTAQFRHNLNGPFTAADVAIALTHLKLSRIANTPAHADSWVDALGYIALGAELATGEAGGAGEDSVASEAPSKPAEQGFRVGARVRVLDTCDFRTGDEGEIVGSITYDDRFDWRVQLDGYIMPSEFRTSEIEVIG